MMQNNVNIVTDTEKTKDIDNYYMDALLIPDINETVGNTIAFINLRRIKDNYNLETRN